ncbi:MAG: hypothetical protein B7Z61_02630 [Acidobacteria bacterium 37-71-11]|nr:MAG: hypothetical protein B7Z61_02630 [Acidobacteria bacterium 37-71-11]
MLCDVTERAAGVVTAVFGPLVRVQVGEDALVVPFRRTLHWAEGIADRRLVVGDRVALEGKPPDSIVTGVEARRTTLTRRSPGERRSRVIAANVDQAVVVMAAVSPEPNPRLLDRFLVACNHAGIEPVICFNKVDQGTAGIDAWIGDYVDAGYELLLASARTSRGVGCLTRKVAGRTTLFPGVREFGFWDLAPSELQAYFPEIARAAAGCSFADCTHESEAACAVRDAAQSGKLSARRYTSFLKLRQELEATADRA